MSSGGTAFVGMEPGVEPEIEFGSPPAHLSERIPDDQLVPYWKWPEREETARRALADNGRVGHDPERPFALGLDEFIAAESDVPAALIGDESEVLLPAFGLMILFAKGGKGKTTLTLDAALHLASGIDWLGVRRAATRCAFSSSRTRDRGSRSGASSKLKREAWPHEIDGRDVHPDIRLGRPLVRQPRASRRAAARLHRGERDRPGGRRPARLARHRRRWLAGGHAQVHGAAWSRRRPLPERRLPGSCTTRARNRVLRTSSTRQPARGAASRTRCCGLTKLEGRARPALVPEGPLERPRDPTRADPRLRPGDEGVRGRAARRTEEERDYAAEIEALLADGKWRTASEVAAPERTAASAPARRRSGGS